MLWRWETDAYPGLHVEGPQGLIDDLMHVEDADIVIGIFWTRFGTPTRSAQSGTEHELRRAWSAWQQRGRPQVMLYFSSRACAPRTSEDFSQWQKVMAFKEGLPPEMLCWAYGRPREFERVLREHLSRYLLEQSARQGASAGPRVAEPADSTVSQPALALAAPNASDPEGRPPERDETGAAQKEASQRFQREPAERQRFEREQASQRARTEFEKQQQRLASAREQRREWDERVASQQATAARDARNASERDPFLTRASTDRDERAPATAGEGSPAAAYTTRALASGPNERRTMAGAIARYLGLALGALVACYPIAVLAFAVWYAFTNHPLGSMLWVVALCIACWLLSRLATDEG